MQHQQSVVLKEEEEGRSRSRGKSKGDPSSSSEEQEQEQEKERRKLVEGGVVEEVGLGNINININIKKVRHPHTIRYIEKKMADKGIHRMDRHPADGLSLAHAPPKSGHGGKFTWEGPIHTVETELDPVPPAIDPRDPNYVPDDDDNNDDVEKVVIEEEEEEAAAAEKPLVIGEVEVAKAAEAKAGVSRIEVHPPLSSSTAD